MRAVALAMILVMASTPLAPRAEATCKLPSLGPERVAARVIDGETLEFADGTRAILANAFAPKAADFGIEGDRLDAARRATAALDALVTGQSVRLLVDAAPKDRYGATRAMVKLVALPEAPAVQVLLARDGHVRALARLGERTCIEDVLRAEDDARAHSRGMWSDPAFRVRSARPARNLTAFRGSFQIVAGEVHSVERSRDHDRLVLGPDRRRDLTVSLRSNDRALSGSLGGDVKSLVGRRIEARGWLTPRSGSFGALDIDVSLVGHVRVVGE